MKISFSDKFNSNDNLVIIYSNKNLLLKKNKLSMTVKYLIEKVEKLKKSKESFTEFFTIPDGKQIKKVLISKIKPKSGTSYTEALAGRILSQLERNNIEKVTVIIEVDSNRKDLLKSIKDLTYGFLMKDYRFEKYKTITKKDFKILSISFAFVATQSEKRILENHIQMVKGIYLTRDLVSEPANELYPEKFVQLCNVLKKVGIKSEILNEKQIKKLGMNALMGVAQGSVKPPRVLVMKWNGKKDKNFANPLSFIGKGVTFDTGGISIKPSGGMEDMKWDMGGAAVTAAIMKYLSEINPKLSYAGIVGLVENMPSSTAYKPGDIIKSYKGINVEVLNTDAEGRLVLADIITYGCEVYNPKIVIDFATLTGAIVVALGQHYAGLYSNDDIIADKLYDSGIDTNEKVWRMPLHDDFDKELNSPFVDLKNIGAGRYGGSITAAQFLQRFIPPKTKWAHLDIAGTTWKNNGDLMNSKGATGFGLTLIADFIDTYFKK